MSFYVRKNYSYAIPPRKIEISQEENVELSKKEKLDDKTTILNEIYILKKYIDEGMQKLKNELRDELKNDLNQYSQELSFMINNLKHEIKEKNEEDLEIKTCFLNVNSNIENEPKSDDDTELNMDDISNIHSC